MIDLMSDELEVVLAEIRATLRDLDAEHRRVVYEVRLSVGRWLREFGMRLRGGEPGMCDDRD
jgi:hypothetical protein